MILSQYIYNKQTELITISISQASWIFPLCLLDREHGTKQH